MCGEVRAQQLAVAERGEARRWIAEPARAHVGTVAAELQRIGEADEGSEGESEDALGIVELRFLQRTDRNIHGHRSSWRARNHTARRFDKTAGRGFVTAGKAGPRRG